MGKGRRIDRVNQLLLEEIAKVIQEDLRDPALGFTTVVRVETSKDLKNADVHVSFLESAEAEKGLAALNRAAGFIRNTIMPHVQIKIFPALRFIIDDTAARAVRISALLKDGGRPVDVETDK